MTCTFFGSRDISQEKIEKPLTEVLTNLIENHNVDNFYVGNQGNFDFLVQKQLKKLKLIYPHINYGIALAYMPKSKEEYPTIDYSKTFVPDGIEIGPTKFAIDRRNRWLIKNSDYIITCVRGSIGGAAKYKEIAERKGKTIICIKYTNDYNTFLF